MADKLRCAVIGAGSTGTEHLLSFCLTHRAAAVALAERNPATAREACDRFKITRSYSDFRELLDQPDIDAVIVALPNHLHGQVALLALQARKHVFLEFPMAANHKDALKLIETAKRMKRALMVNQTFRLHRQIQTARAIIERGDLGEVYHARGFFLRRQGIPRIGSWCTQKQYAGGGCAVDLGIQLLDSCLHLLGDFNVTSLSAHTHSRLGPLGLGETDWGKSEVDPRRPFDVDDYSMALLRLRNGRSILLENSWAGFHAPDAREHTISILGTKGGLDLFPARLFRAGLNGYEILHPNNPKPLQPEHCLHHFVNCILDGKKPLLPPEEALKLQEILAALYASAQSGKEIFLK